MTRTEWSFLAVFFALALFLFISASLGYGP